MKKRRLGHSDLYVSKPCLDTAEMYATPPGAKTYGSTETIISNWSHPGRREHIVPASKVTGHSSSMPHMCSNPNLSRTHI